MCPDGTVDQAERESLADTGIARVTVSPNSGVANRSPSSETKTSRCLMSDLSRRVSEMVTVPCGAGGGRRRLRRARMTSFCGASEPFQGRATRLQAGVAQLVEQLIRNQQVLGSCPSAGSRFPEKIHSSYLGVPLRPATVDGWWTGGDVPKQASATRQPRSRLAQSRRDSNLSLSLPHRLRYLLAWDHDLCRAVSGVAVRTVLGFLRRRARVDRVADGRSGAVVILQALRWSVESQDPPARAPAGRRVHQRRRRRAISSASATDPRRCGRRGDVIARRVARLLERRARMRSSRRRGCPTCEPAAPSSRRPRLCMAPPFRCARRPGVPAEEGHERPDKGSNSCWGITDMDQRHFLNFAARHAAIRW